MNADPRFPIGKFQPPEAYDPTLIASGLATLAALPQRLGESVRDLGELQLDSPYREGGWTIRQLVHHIADSHINAYCRMRLALTEELPTIRLYDEKRWADLTDSRTMSLAPSLAILDGLHQRWIGCLASLDQASWQRELIHPERPRPLPLWWMLALYSWHSLHHVAHISSWRKLNSLQPGSK
jgi:hypothetical protein